MKLHISRDWLRNKVKEMDEAGIEEPSVIGPKMVNPEMLSPIDDLLTLLATAPDSQLDSTMIPRVSALIGKDQDTVKNALKDILDECVHASLCSGFVVGVMDTILNTEYEE